LFPFEVTHFSSITQDEREPRPTGIGWRVTFGTYAKRNIRLTFPQDLDDNKAGGTKSPPASFS